MPTLRRVCARCGAVLTGPCRACERARWARRGTPTQRGLGYEFQKKRPRILARDRGVCWICGLPGADTVDHVLARSRGGDDSLDNLRAAHRQCNSARR